MTNIQAVRELVKRIAAMFGYTILEYASEGYLFQPCKQNVGPSRGTVERFVELMMEEKYNSFIRGTVVRIVERKSSQCFIEECSDISYFIEVK